MLAELGRRAEAVRPLAASACWATVASGMLSRSMSQCRRTASVRLCKRARQSCKVVRGRRADTAGQRVWIRRCLVTSSLAPHTVDSAFTLFGLSVQEQ